MATLWTTPSHPVYPHGRRLIISELLGSFQHFTARVRLLFHHRVAMRACFHLVLPNMIRPAAAGL
jgi:hypothetical protein